MILTIDYKGLKMNKRVGILWNILAIICFITWSYRGWDNLSGTFICFCAILYYGENILNKMEQ